MQIQWYPGHMMKTRREVVASLHLVDLIIEIVDARIPRSSRNPDIDAMVGDKPRLVILNRRDLADAAATKRWRAALEQKGYAVLETDSKSGAGVSELRQACKTLLAPLLARRAEKGQAGRGIKAMVLGIPNVGKSTFINKVSGRKAARAENRPGVTRGRQWIQCGDGLELLDTPGMLWPRFDDETTGMHLAFTGAVKDAILDIEGLGLALSALLASRYRSNLEARYKITLSGEMEPLAIYEEIAKSRGFLFRGGDFDYTRCATNLLEEYRNGKLGRITLEEPAE